MLLLCQGDNQSSQTLHHLVRLYLRCSLCSSLSLDVEGYKQLCYNEACWQNRGLAGVVDGEVLLDNYEDHAKMILTGCLSESILQQGRAHVTFF